MFRSPGIVGSLGLLLLRVTFGGMLLWGHGLSKVTQFNELKDKFFDPSGIFEPPFALGGVIGAELLCAALVIIGLLTRVATLPVVFAMSVAAFFAHADHPTFLAEGVTHAKEPALMYLFAFATLFFTGPGLFSLDAAIFRRRTPPSV